MYLKFCYTSMLYRMQSIYGNRVLEYVPVCPLLQILYHAYPRIGRPCI